MISSRFCIVRSCPLTRIPSPNSVGPPPHYSFTFVNIYLERWRTGNSKSADDNSELVGEVSLPLNQLRWKESYHIWLPLEVPAHIMTTAAPTVLKPNYGRLRLKVQWLASPVLA